MKSKMKIGFWGQLGPETGVADGQAIKTRIIIKESKDRFGEENVLITNTYKWNKRPVSFFIHTVKLFYSSTKVIILPADNGFRIIVPLYDFLGWICRKPLYYIVIGGFLTDLLKKSRLYLRMVRKYRALFVETEGMRKELLDLGVQEVFVLPNFKPLTPTPLSSIQINNDVHIKLCSFSRITPEKGIAESIEAVKICNDKLGENVVSLDFFGLIDPAYYEHFMTSINGLKYCKYKGIVDYLNTVNVIKDYFCVIFPTYYHGEGFAGIIVDTYFSGVPIIATDWKYNSDVIVDSVNGFLVPIKDPDSIADRIIELYNDRKKHYQICYNNLVAAKKYDPESVMDIFYKAIGAS